MKKPLKINWKKLRNNIPDKISIGPRYSFDVLWVDDCGKSKNGKPLYGMTNFHPNVIRLLKSQEDDDAVKSFFHEFIHTTDMYKKGQNLHENQVAKIENRFEWIYLFFLTILDENDIIKAKENEHEKI